jgi:hypothetical protein
MAWGNLHTMEKSPVHIEFANPHKLHGGFFFSTAKAINDNLTGTSAGSSAPPEQKRALIGMESHGPLWAVGLEVYK